MPKSVQGRLLFTVFIVGLLLIIGRNVYRHAREAEFESALKNGDDASALMLWNQGVYGNQPQQWTRLLDSALRHNMPEFACGLLQRGAHPNQVPPDKGAPNLIVAIEYCPDAAKCLLEKGADVNEGSNNVTPLNAAASKRRIDIARLLLDRGANVNANADTGFTALNSAVNAKDMAMVRLLLEHGAVADGKPPKGDDTSLGFRPLSSAVLSGNVDMLKLLLAHHIGGASKNDALREAIARKRHDMVQLLLAQGASADVHSFDWQALLRSAQQTRDANMLALLQKAGISPAQAKVGLNAKNAQGQTVFLAALTNGQTEMAQSLLAQGAEVNVQDSKGETPLTEAMQHCPALVPTLLARGAKVKVVTQPFGLTPLHLAVNADDLQTARLLLQHGADPNACPPHAHTPLYRARKHNQTAMVQILQEAGASVEK